MSEFKVEVVKLEKTEKHPNADSLSIAEIFNGYPVVYKTDNFNQGDKVVYIPIDSLCPVSRPEFSFLDSGKEFSRIKAKKIRKIFSMGMLVPANPEWEVGRNVQEELGIQKYEPMPKNVRLYSQTDSIEAPGIMPIYTDIEGLRKYPNIFKRDEEVVVSEKIHGANLRCTFAENSFWVGSHRCVKKRDERNAWWKVAMQLDLETFCRTFPDVVFFGEMFGQVQDLRYETKPEELLFRVFDAYDRRNNYYFDYDMVERMCKASNIPMVPELYRGAWSEELKDLAEGKSTLAPSHVREGFVVKPTHERFDREVGRVIFKMVGEKYLLRKEAA